MRRSWLLGAFCAGLFCWLLADALQVRGFAQEPEKAAAKKERDKAKGYLPPFYRDVIDGVQREKIYKLQDEYDAKINPLVEQIRTLRMERDAAIAGLLTAEQKQRLQELQTEAKSKKSADDKAKASAKSDEAK